MANGQCPFEPQLEELRRLGTHLNPERTPQIILNGFDEELKTGAAGSVEVPRMKRPFYPRKWLVSGLVFGNS
jgi:hypothetical protein